MGQSIPSLDEPKDIWGIGNCVTPMEAGLCSLLCEFLLCEFLSELPRLYALLWQQAFPDMTFLALYSQPNA